MKKNRKKAFIPPCKKFPNLFYEYHYEVAGSKLTYCDRANVTDEVFDDVFQGRDSLTFNEAAAIRGLYDGAISNVTMEYLFSDHMSVYDMRKPKHLHKFIILFHEFEEADRLMQDLGLENMRYKRLPSLKAIKGHDFIPRAYYNYLLRRLEIMNLDIQLARQRKKKPRSPLPLEIVEDEKANRKEEQPHTTK